MRKTPETINDSLVRLGVTRQLGIVERGKQRQRLRLVSRLLAVLERQVEKHPLILAETPIQPRVDSLPRKRKCGRIGRERAWRAAKHIARELIECDHGGKRCAGIEGRLGRHLAHELIVKGEKPISDKCIRCFRLREPGLAIKLAEPEVENLVSPRR